MGTASRKVRGGKLLRVRLKHDGSTITEIMITGDFFLHPEDGLAMLEVALLGTSIEESERELAKRVEGVLSENRLVILGFGPADLAAAIKEARS